VIEAVFHDRLPEINHAITVPRASGAEEAEGVSTDADALLVCEVQQHSETTGCAPSRWTPLTVLRGARR